MLWGQDIKVYTDHKNLTRDALGLTSDRVYCWRLLLEEYAPEIIHIQGIHNTVADAISLLEYDPKLNTTNEYTHAMLGAEPEELSAQRWKSFVHHQSGVHPLQQVSPSSKLSLLSRKSLSHGARLLPHPYVYVQPTIWLLHLQG